MFRRVILSNAKCCEGGVICYYIEIANITWQAALIFTFWTAKITVLTFWQATFFHGWCDIDTLVSFFYILYNLITGRPKCPGPCHKLSAVILYRMEFCLLLVTPFLLFRNHHASTRSNNDWETTNS